MKPKARYLVGGRRSLGSRLRLGVRLRGRLWLWLGSFDFLTFDALDLLVVGGRQRLLGDFLVRGSEAERRRLCGALEVAASNVSDENW